MYEDRHAAQIQEGQARRPERTPSLFWEGLRLLAFAAWFALLCAFDWSVVLKETPMSLQRNGGWGNVHEKTHGVNSELRQKHGGDCFYVMWGRCATFAKLRSPTIAQVSQRVRYRGGVAWYLTDSHSWNDTPLYLFDELVSYTNGTVDAWNNQKTDNNATLQYALEFSHYTAVLVEMIPTSYADRKRVAIFWCWNAIRLDTIAKKSKQYGFLWRSQCDGWHSQLSRDWEKIVKIVNGP